MRSSAGFDQRPQWRPVYTRNRLKLILRTAALPFVALRNRRRRRRKRFPIVVLYHHLTSDRPKFMSLPTAQFARHVRFLQRHYRIVSVDEAVAMLAKDEVPEPTVVLTLDDGYAENFSGTSSRRRARARADDNLRVRNVATEASWPMTSSGGSAGSVLWTGKKCGASTGTA